MNSFDNSESSAHAQLSQVLAKWCQQEDHTYVSPPQYRKKLLAQILQEIKDLAEKENKFLQLITDLGEIDFKDPQEQQIVDYLLEQALSKDH